MANDTAGTALPGSWSLADDVESLLDEIANHSVPTLMTLPGAPLLTDAPSTTVLPPIGEEVVGCFAHRDLQQFVAASECRFVIGLLVGTVIATCLLIAFAFFLACCFVLCRLRRKRKLRRNLTVRSDSMLDLALPKKLSPAGPPRTQVQELHIPRVSQRISAYGPPGEDFYAADVARRALADTNGTNRYSSFSPYNAGSTYSKTYRMPNGPQDVYSVGPMSPAMPMSTIYAPPDLFAEQNRRAFLNYSSHMAQRKMSEDNDNDYDATTRRPSSQYAERNSTHFGEADVVFRNQSRSPDVEFRNTRC